MNNKYELVAYQPETGRAFVRYDGRITHVHMILEPTECSESTMRAVTARECYTMCDLEFSSWPELNDFLDEKYLDEMENRPHVSHEERMRTIMGYLDKQGQ